VTKVDNSSCLKKLVELIPRRLAEVIKKERATTRL
jgi:septin family protein